MSSAHRPTWTPAQAKDAHFKTRVYSARDLASHTRLKFRQPGQTAKSEVERRDLKLELLKAEREADIKKGKTTAEPEQPTAGLLEGPSRVSKLIAEIAEDESDESDDDDDGERPEKKAKADLEAKPSSDESKGGEEDEAQESSDEESDSDGDDSEDETALLLKELEKIKRERAEEKAKQEKLQSEQENVSREEEIARGNPLLDLQSALGYSPAPSTTTESTSFGVKRRWDDDVIFKNQARDTSDTAKKEFVNDLLRTEFHKRFMKKFIG